MTCEPILQRERAGAVGKAKHATSLSFVSPAAAAANVGEEYGLEKRVVPVSGTRTPGKDDMLYNDYCPDHIEVDPETFEVQVDGEHVTCEPASELPLAQRYML
jgi:urease subunit alpha